MDRKYALDLQKFSQFVLKGRHDDAIQLGTKLAKSKECPTDVFSMLGLSYMAKSEDNRRAKELTTKGMAWLERADKIKPLNDLRCLSVMANGYSVLKNYVKLLDMAKRGVKVLETLPDTEEYKKYRRDMYRSLGTAAGYLGDSVLSVDGYNESYRYADDLNEKVELLGNILFRSQTLDFSSEDIFDLARSFEKLFVAIERYPHDLAAIAEEIRSTGRKIRVGYISPDFRRHVVFDFVYGLLMEYDREHFEVFCYHTNDEEDAVTEKIKSSVDYFVNLTDGGEWSFASAAKKIYEDKIDILFDLAGHTGGGSGLAVLASKPAPVQISGIGHLGTTGLSTVDYFLTDKIVDPPGMHDKYFVEKLLYVTSHFCYQNTADSPAPAGAPCLNKDYVLFASFNQYLKLNDDMLLAWKEILSRVDNSRLLLKNSLYSATDFVEAAKERFRRLGLPVERIDFEQADGKYMYRYADVDIALDTYPYTGGGTTFSALVMGVPVITMYGERRNTRFSYGILHCMNLPQLAVTNLRDYVELTVSLAQDKELLDRLHRQIPKQFYGSFVGQPKLYAQELEERYREILGLT